MSLGPLGSGVGIHNGRMDKLMTLTVPDVLWVNLQLTKTPAEYHFGRLEEATFYQYAYGSSVDVVGQAARFVTGFVEMKPFSKGNQATAFAALVAFLECNGYELGVAPEDALAWVRGVWADPAGAEGKISAAVYRHEVHLHYGVPEKKETLIAILKRYESALGTLLAEEPEAAWV